MQTERMWLVACVGLLASSAVVVQASGWRQLPTIATKAQHQPRDALHTAPAVANNNNNNSEQRKSHLAFFLSDYSQKWQLVGANRFEVEMDITYRIVSGQLHYLSKSIAFAKDTVSIASVTAVAGNNSNNTTTTTAVPTTAFVRNDRDYKMVRVYFDTPVSHASATSVTVTVAYSLTNTRALCRDQDTTLEFNPDWATKWARGVASHNNPSVTFSFQDRTAEVSAIEQDGTTAFGRRSHTRGYSSVPASWVLLLTVSAAFADDHDPCSGSGSDNAIVVLIVVLVVVAGGGVLAIAACVLCGCCSGGSGGGNGGAYGVQPGGCGGGGCGGGGCGGGG